MAGQIDMNMQSEMMAAFEESLERSARQTISTFTTSKQTNTRRKQKTKTKQKRKRKNIWHKHLSGAFLVRIEIEIDQLTEHLSLTLACTDWNVHQIRIKLEKQSEK